MVSNYPVNVIGELICILDRILRRIGIRANLSSEITSKIDIGEFVETGELVVGDGVILAKPVVTYTKLVGYLGPKCMVVPKRESVISLRQRGPEYRQIRGIVKLIRFVVNVPTAELIIGLNVVIDAAQICVEICVIGSRDVNDSIWDIHPINAGSLGSGWGRRDIFFENIIVRG